MNSWLQENKLENETFRFTIKILTLICCLRRISRTVIKNKNFLRTLGTSVLEY